MKRWPTRPLGDVLEVSRERIQPLEYPDTFFNYVGLENVEGHTGKLLPYQPTPGMEIKSTKNVFHPGQILFGKLRPYLNKVHLAREKGICSTDIYVLNPRHCQMDAAFASYFLRSPGVLAAVSRAMAGANLPRINEESLLEIPAPVPPMAEQEGIVKLLDEADGLRTVRAQADRRTADLIPALFHEMFGDPTTNPKGWPLTRIGELTEFITSGSRGWAEYYSDMGAKFIRVQNLTRHRLSFDDVAFVCAPVSAESKRTRVQPKDLLVTITGVVGLVAIAPVDIGDAHVSQHVAIVRLSDQINSTFAQAFLADPSGGQRQISEMQYGQTKPGLNLSQIRSIQIFLPPHALQCEFAAHFNEIRSMEGQQAESRRRLDGCFQSLLHQAFNGGL